MNIAILGTGYVGLTVGVCFAEKGNRVICTDIDLKKIDMLEKGRVPFYEPQMSEFVKKNTDLKRLIFTTDIGKAIESSDIVFCTVPTPLSKNGEIELKFVKQAAEDFAKHLNGYKIFVIKSTVPIGTYKMCGEIIRKEGDSRNFAFDVVSNPEFLRQGNAIKDMMSPERIIIGLDSNNQKTRETIEKLYIPFAAINRPIVFTDPKGAEMIKCCSNSFLAVKVSFINEIANFCEHCGANIKEVARGMGLDSRIGENYLDAGIGYGGSCLNKDTKALINQAGKFGIDLRILKAADQINEDQKKLLLKKVYKKFKNLKGIKVAIWGVSFKPNTDDIREAPSIKIVKELLKKGAKIKIFDPAAGKKFKVEYFKHESKVIVTKDCYSALVGAKVLLLLTEWDEFKNPDFNKIKKLMKGNLILDGRNVYDAKEVKKYGFEYEGIGIC